MVGGIRAPDLRTPVLPPADTPPIMTFSTPVRLAVYAMATRFELLLNGDDPVRLRAAGEEALHEIESLDHQLSRFRADSDIARINALASSRPVKVEPQLLGLLTRAIELSKLTDGAFDITMGPLMAAWGLVDGTGRLPSELEMRSARERTGSDHLVLDSAASMIRFDRDGIQIDLGAIGKGYAIDRAVEALRDSGVQSALIHGGTSTIYGLGAPPDAEAWRVGVSDPTTARALPDAVDLRDSALSVSAVHGKSFTRDGRVYGHVIDPRTGEPANVARLAAVWGPSATDTDALSTALLVLGEAGVDRMPGYRGLVLK